MVKANVLLIDDDDSLRKVVGYNLGKHGFRVVEKPDGESALEAFNAEQFEIVITDINMPGITGMEFLSKVKQLRPETEVILITAYATVESAIDAMKKGAFDYVTKPFGREELTMVIERALKIKTLERENRSLKDSLRDKHKFKNILGVSPAMQKVLSMAQKVAASEANILILGESGTGKELLAKGVHFNSERRSGPLVVVNCAAIPDTLIESELFGYRKGAFTGAVANKIGKFEAANGGTIFLDEIGELKPELQAKMLRVLQEREIEPLGETQSRAIDVRVIAATNVDITKAVKEKNFRQDLYYRISVITLSLPSLAERREDIPLLVNHFLEKYSKDEKLKIGNKAMEFIKAYSWPGNVRELENVIEHVSILREGPSITAADLPDVLKQQEKAFGGLRLDIPPEGIDIEALDKELVIHALKIYDGNQTRAARFLHMTRPTFIYRMEKYGLKSGGDQNKI